MVVPVGSPDEWQAIIGMFLRDHVRRAGAEGIVVGVSGGLDSAVVAALAVQALGPKAVTPILMPAADSLPQDEADGRLLCQHLGIEPLLRPIDALMSAAEATVALDTPQLRGNAKARARMLILYAEGQAANRLVAGTGNKSELLVGYFTKHGDGGNDLQPIGDLYKTQVQQLARHLGLPAALIEKAPSAGLWEGQTDEQELGMSYAALDRILKGIEMNSDSSDIVVRAGATAEAVDRIVSMVRRSEHKRHTALVPKIGARTVGIDWRRSVHWDA